MKISSSRQRSGAPKTAIIPAALLFLASVAFSAAPEDGSPRMAFRDADGDGRNDWFRDANGDGNNDLDGQPYAHHFDFTDNNQDGINDLYADEDGDGVNDLQTGFMDRNGDGWNDNVIDADQDWVNDITGMVYNRRSLRGERYGFVLEERGQRIRDYFDRNGDGRDDRVIPDSRGPHGPMDEFIDVDGDGVCDTRDFDRHRRGQRQRGRMP